MAKLYSYDVFDTLITRKVATPKGIFAVMQHHLQNDAEFQNLPEYLRWNFYSIRIKAEEFVRQYGTTSEEISLSDIYSYISTTYSLDDSVAAKLGCLECEIEKKYIVGIPERIASLKRHQEVGDRVVLISDMYLPKDILQQILVGIDCVFAEIPFYLSSELGVRKTTGNIYRYVQKMEGVKYSSWVHIGDNIFQDILIPKRLGIRVRRVRKPGLLEYETKLLQNHEASVTVQTVVGHSRYLRVLRPVNEAILASCGFTLLYPYVSWVVRQAVHVGLSDLYFISRDGYVLKLLADTIIDSKKLPIRTHYIYGSRDAWRVPVSFDDALRIYEPKGTKLSSLLVFLDKIGVSYSDVESILPEKYHDSSKNLSVDDFSEILHLIQTDGQLSQMVRDNWISKQNLVLSYFNQEIDFKNGSFGFVDVGGSGLTMDTVQSILSPVYSKPLPVFYLTVTGKFDTVYGSRNHNKLIWGANLKSRILLEAFCRAPHTKCIGYTFDETMVVPVFEDGDMDNDVLDGYLSLLSNLAQEFTKSGVYDELPNEGFAIFDACMSYLSSTPSKDIVSAVGDIPFEYDSISGEVQSFAPRYSFFSFVREAFGYIKRGYFASSAYPEYSLWRGGWVARRMGGAFSKYRKFRHIRDTVKI